MTPSPTIHVPVLPAEILDWLSPLPGQTIVDGTLGGGGHTKLLAERVAPDGVVLSLDRDAAALLRAEERLAGLPVMLAHANFADLPQTLLSANLSAVDGILLDLGLSSDQLADAARGFSFESTGPLDLRFDADHGKPAWKLLASMREKELADLIFHYGEERYARRIAREIVKVRGETPLRTAADLAALVRRCVPRSPKERIDPATRTFQALRIAVNDELRSLEIALKQLPNCLKPGGRLAVISFHSLEDRLVKEAFRQDERWHALTRKPVAASDAEVAANPRSRSAKLRVAERTDVNVLPENSP